MENNAIFTTTKISDTLYQIHEEGAGQSVDCYLILGTDRAALVDSLMSRGDRRLYDIVREITSMPVTVLHTHGHGDHVGAELKEFFESGCGVHVSEKDHPIMGTFGANFPKENFKPLSEGDKFPLGGCTLEVIEIAGHTPGSVVFLDRENGRLFSGDSIGSGHFWMQLGHSEPLTTLIKGVEKLLAVTEGMELLIYPGHRSQSPVQLTRHYIVDLHELLQDVIAGKAVGEEVPAMGPGKAPHTRAVSRGTVVSMLYDEEKII